MRSASDLDAARRPSRPPHIEVDGPDHGLRQPHADGAPHLHHPPRRRVRDHGRQRLGQEHAHAPSGRAAAAGGGHDPPGRRQLLGRGPDEQQALQRRFGVMYQQGALWTSMTLAENVALPLGTYTDLDAGGGGRARRVQAGAGRARRLRRLLPVRDQRRHAQARRDRARHGAGPGDPVPRRAVGRPRPDQLAAAGRPDPRAAATAWA